MAAFRAAAERCRTRLPLSVLGSDLAALTDSPKRVVHDTEARPAKADRRITPEEGRWLR